MPSVTDRLLIMYGILLQRFFLCYNSCVEECFWNEVFHLVSCIPQNEMVVFAGDMNGHVGGSNAGYDGTHDVVVVVVTKE